MLLAVVSLYGLFRGMSFTVTKREEQLNKEYNEKFSKFIIEEQKDREKIKEIQEEYRNKNHKAHLNTIHNEEAYTVKYNKQILEDQSEELNGFGIYINRLETVKLKDVKDECRDTCKQIFPQALLEAPDFDLSLKREHEMLEYQMHRYWMKKKQNKTVKPITQNMNMN